jgi:hypothetical protein
MENDKSGVLWSLAAQLHEAVSEQIALRIPGRVSAGDSESGPQVGKPLGLFGPDEAFQPTDL